MTGVFIRGERFEDTEEKQERRPDPGRRENWLPEIMESPEPAAVKKLIKAEGFQSHQAIRVI